jgi:hypothetical protein
MDVAHNDPFQGSTPAIASQGTEVAIPITRSGIDIIAVE